MKPLVAHAGIGHFSVIAKGRAAHASQPSKGRSAIKDMMKIIEALEENYIPGLKATHPLCGSAQCSINMIKGGRQVNAIPDECEIRVDRRIMPGESVAGVIPAVKKVLATLKKSDPGIRYEVRVEFRDDPLSQDLNSKFIKWVLKVLKAQGLSAKPAGAQFATDAGALSSAGFPCVVLGPGDDSLAHTANESIKVHDLINGVKIFKKLMTTPY
jgi:acetylornithine deacetylase/succinyl-diaminopimelate desuccinylase-like protein